jgi:ribosomal protein S18 acetylase RimI-like enzyme
MEESRVRPARESDLEAIVHLHARAFPEFFLTLLGPTFLRELYRAFMTDAKGLSLVALDANCDAVVGAVAGTTEPNTFFRGLLRRRALAFACAALPALCRHPLRVARRMLAALFYRGEIPPQLPDAALLSSLAIEPRAQGQGVGARLVEAFCKQVSARGAQYVYLTTDETGNDRGNTFYARCGFSLLAHLRRADGRLMKLYYRSVSDERSGVVRKDESR